MQNGKLFFNLIYEYIEKLKAVVFDNPDLGLWCSCNLACV